VTTPQEHGSRPPKPLGRRWFSLPGHKDPRHDLGLRGEDAAAAYLRKLGYRILARRERVLRGDIDIVALDERTVVFVEVRTRTDTRHGHPAETVGYRKQRRIAELCNAYIRRHRLEDCRVRIDVVAVTFPEDGLPQVEHFQDAFESPW
jgi:putative endonuclease